MAPNVTVHNLMADVVPNIIEDVVNAIHKHNQILCISHINPDGDAYGSLLGMGWLLRQLGKRVTLSMHDRTPREFAHMPGIGNVISPHAVADDYGLIICLDASSMDRMGAVYREDVHRRIPLVVIDHHITNTHFGNINWVAPECAATCQMLVTLAAALDAPLTPQLSECLLTGLVTDTLGFRTSNTTPAVLEAAIQLMHGGADLAAITQRMLSRHPFNTFRLWGLVLPTVQLAEGVVWATISRAQVEQVGKPGDDGQLSSMLITVEEADMSATFTEKMDEAGNLTVECSFRARRGFNVGALALELGGGGHPAASGCTMRGKLPDVAERVVAQLKAARQQQASEVPALRPTQGGA